MFNLQPLRYVAGFHFSGSDHGLDFLRLSMIFSENRLPLFGIML
jgi:hypothetical protein